MVGPQAGDGQLALDAALRRQRVGEADAPQVGHGVGGEVIQHCGRVGADQVELREGGGVEDPDPLAHGPALLGHRVEPAGAAERDHVLWGQPGCSREPFGPLPAVDLREHRSLAVQAPVQGCGAVGAPGRPFQAGQRCLVAVLVVLGSLRAAVGDHIGTVDVAQPAGVVGPNADAGGAVHHPAGQLPAQARPVGDPYLHAGHLPEVGQPRRAQQGLAVGRVGDRAADHLLDSQRLEHRHPLEGPGQPQAHPVEVGVEQRVLQRPVRPVGVVPDRLGAGLFVDADQARLLLLAQVPRHVVVAHDRQLAVEIGELGHRLGQQVGVQHVGDGHVEPHHPGYPVGVAAGRVDDVLGMDGTPLGVHIEAAVTPPPDPHHPVSAADGRAQVAGGPHHGVGCASGIHMAVMGGVDRAEHPVGGVERVQLGHARRVDPLHGVAHVGGRAELGPQPVDLLGVIGHPEAAAAVPGGGHPALGLERGVQLAGVPAELGQRVARHRVRDLARGVPGRA